MNEHLIAVAQAMENRGFQVYLTADRGEACEKVLQLVEEGQTVGAGGSMTLAEIGVLPRLGEEGHSVYCHTGARPEEVRPLQLKAREADCYLCSANAVTADGILLLVDGRGNRVGAVCDGPAHLIFVIGANKLTSGGLSAAVARVKQTAAPLNTRRLHCDTPCAQYGSCRERECDNSICNLTLFVDHPPRGRRVSVILCEENLGY